MPLRIAIAGAIALAACLVVPMSVNAVSSQDGKADTVEEADPPEPDPSIAPVTAALASDGVRGANISAAGYGANLTWLTLLTIILAGFVPAVIMMVRSSHRTRAGPMDRIS